jgi:helix-turn-helix protein
MNNFMVQGTARADFIRIGNTLIRPEHIKGAESDDDDEEDLSIALYSTEPVNYEVLLGVDMDEFVCILREAGFRVVEQKKGQ